MNFNVKIGLVALTIAIGFLPIISAETALDDAITKGTMSMAQTMEALLEFYETVPFNIPKSKLSDLTKSVNQIVDIMDHVAKVIKSFTPSNSTSDPGKKSKGKGEECKKKSEPTPDGQ